MGIACANLCAVAEASLMATCEHIRNMVDLPRSMSREDLDTNTKDVLSVQRLSCSTWSVDPNVRTTFTQLLDNIQRCKQGLCLESLTSAMHFRWIDKSERIQSLVRLGRSGNDHEDRFWTQCALYATSSHHHKGTRLSDDLRRKTFTQEQWTWESCHLMQSAD